MDEHQTLPIRSERTLTSGDFRFKSVRPICSQLHLRIRERGRPPGAPRRVAQGTTARGFPFLVGSPHSTSAMALWESYLSRFFVRSPKWHCKCSQSSVCVSFNSQHGFHHPEKTQHVTVLFPLSLSLTVSHAHSLCIPFILPHAKNHSLKWLPKLPLDEAEYHSLC